MKNLLFTLVILLAGYKVVYAQDFKWLFAGGGNGNAIISSELDEVMRLTTDANGNAYGIARTNGTAVTLGTFTANVQYLGAPQFVLFSYNCSGQLRWAQLIQSSAGADAQAIAYCAGNIYVSGRLPGNNKKVGTSLTLTNQFYDDACLISYDTSGNFRWLKFVGVNNAANNYNAASYYSSTLVTDAQDRIHFIKYLGTGLALSAGQMSGRGTYDMVYDNMGTLLSATKFNLDSTLAVCYTALDKKTDKIYCLAYHEGGVANYNTILGAFDANRNLLWLDSVLFTNGYSLLADIVIDDAKNLYFTGGASDSFTYRNNKVYSAGYGPMSVVLKTDSMGAMKWIRPFSYHETSVVYHLALMPGDRIATAGLFGNELISGSDTLFAPLAEAANPFIAIMDNNTGALLRYEGMHGIGLYDRANTLAAAGDGSLYLGGSFENNIWGGTLPPAAIQGGGNRDLFVARYGYDCFCMMPSAQYSYTIDTATMALHLTYTGTLSADSIVWDMGNGQVLTGNLVNQVYASGGQYKVCVYAHSDCGVDTFCSFIMMPGATSVSGITEQKGIQVYPNPAGEYITVKNAVFSGAAIYAMDGKVVYTGMLRSDTEPVNISGLPAGMYLLVLKKDGLVIHKQTIVRR